MVLIDLTIFSLQRMGGISVVWAEYLKRLKVRSKLQYRLYLPKNDNVIAKECDMVGYDIRPVAARNSITKYWPYFLLGRKQDVLHTSYYQWYPFYRGKKVVTLHDFMHEMYAPLATRILHNALKYLSLQSADVILCISNTTKNDLQRIYPKIYASKTIQVIENAASDEFFPTSSDSGKEYLLWVAGRSGYKNFTYALDVMRVLKDRDGLRKLYVVGPPLNDEERKLAGTKGVLGNISVFSRLSTSQLRDMYSDAYALLYLSRYEGFGLPVLEAQQCGCPVIALRSPASQEVGGDSVLYMPDNDETQIIELMHLLDHPEKRQGIVADGFQNAQRYNWEASVDKLIDIYSSCQRIANEQGG